MLGLESSPLSDWARRTLAQHGNIKEDTQLNGIVIKRYM